MDTSSKKLGILHTRFPGYGLKENKFKKVTAFLLIIAQKNAIGTNYIEAKNDNTKQNNKCR